MIDYTFADVADRYHEWAQGVAQIAGALQVDTIAARDAEIATLRQALAASAHDLARLRAELARERRERRKRRKRAPWRDYPLATLATVWEALVGREREHLPALLACLVCASAFLATLLVGPVR